MDIYWLVSGTPPPSTRSIRIRTLANISRQSPHRKRVRGKVLKDKELDRNSANSLDAVTGAGACEPVFKERPRTESRVCICTRSY